MNKSELSTFASSLKFELDPFQVKACVALEAGHGVLVCAPTGAGKTVVGEFAVHAALGFGVSGLSRANCPAAARRSATLRPPSSMAAATSFTPSRS